MKENELLQTISNLYTKFLDVERKNLPHCQCGNLIRTKVLKMGLKIINYGICEYCNIVNYFTEAYEYNQDKYQQEWKIILPGEIKINFEQYLDTAITEKDIKVYSPKFDSIIAKIQRIEEERQLIKVNSLSKSSEYT